MTSQDKLQEADSTQNVKDCVQYLVNHFVDRFVAQHYSEDLEGLHKFLVGSIEERLIKKTLESCRGNKVRAAKVLGIHRNTLSQKLKNYQNQ